MKKILSLAFLLTLSISTYADSYKILFMNHPDLWINGKKAKVGDTFDGNAIVRWAKERQAVRLYNISRKKQMLMVARTLNPKGNSIEEILTTNRHLSTHDQFDNKKANIYRLLQGMFDEQYDLMDRVEVDCPKEIPETGYFLASYIYGDCRISKPLIREGNTVVLDRSIFIIDNKVLEPRDVILDIDYIDESNGVPVFVKAGIELFIVPEKL